MDITNQKFGKLRAIRIEKKPTVSDKHQKYYKYWLCECECGKTTIVKEAHLLYGNTKSCGCLHKKKKEEHKDWSGYGEISGDFFGTIRRGAKKRNLKFNIKIEDIWGLFLKQNKKCAISGIDLKFSLNGKSHDGNASLDRIDSSKGYEVDNIQWVDKNINMMKRTLSQKDFLDICWKVCDNNPRENKSTGN